MSSSFAFTNSKNLNNHNKKFAYIEKHNNATTEKQKENQKEKQLQTSKGFPSYGQKQKRQYQYLENQSNFNIKNKILYPNAYISTSQNNQNSSYELNRHSTAKVKDKDRNKNNEDFFIDIDNSPRVNGSQEKTQLQELFLTIKQLSKQLQYQKNKFKELQEKTIRDQVNVLNSLNFLQQKLKKLSQEKKDLIKQLKILKQESKSLNENESKFKQNSYQQTFYNPFKKDSPNQYSENNSLEEIFNKLTFQLCQNCLQHSQVYFQKITQLFNMKNNQLKQFKKIKGISKSLIDMMKKVEGTGQTKANVSQKNHKKKMDQNQSKTLQVSKKFNKFQAQQQHKHNYSHQNSVQEIDSDAQLKTAWRWIKKIVHQYQMIKKKAYKWKNVYDEVVREDYSSDHSESEENSQALLSEQKEKKIIIKQRQRQISDNSSLKQKEKFNTFTNFNSSQKQQKEN